MLITMTSPSREVDAHDSEAQRSDTRVVRPSDVDRARELLALLGKIVSQRRNAKAVAVQALCPLLVVPGLMLLPPLREILAPVLDSLRFPVALAAVALLALTAVAGLVVKRSSRAAAILEHALSALTDDAQLDPLGSFLIPEAGLSDTLAWEAGSINRKERAARADASRARLALHQFDNKILADTQQAQQSVLEQQLSMAEDLRAAAQQAIAELLSSSHSRP